MFAEQERRLSSRLFSFSSVVLDRRLEEGHSSLRSLSFPAIPQSFGITGDLILDANNNSDAKWIFQATSTLTAASNSKIILLNGAKAENIVWQVGSSATINTDAYFAGTILALESISLNAGATVMGGLLAQNGAVTFDNNTVTVPEGSTVQLLALGIVVLLATKRRNPAYI